MKPPSFLTEQEKAYFDAIKDVSAGPRPKDLQLWRMTLDGRPVAVVCQRLIDDTAMEVGFQPLAILVDDDTASRLVGPSGERGELTAPDGLEGAA
jgi:hypothetical protein